jgi:hypothetical protein
MSIRVSRSPASWPGGASCSNTGTRWPGWMVMVFPVIWLVVTGWETR